MSKLYEKMTNGDKKTIVRRYNKGNRCQFKNGTTVVFSADVRVKVTQQWNDSEQKWIDCNIDYENAVEWEPDPPKAPLPEAKALSPGLLGRIKAFFVKEER